MENLDISSFNDFFKKLDNSFVNSSSVLNKKLNENFEETEEEIKELPNNTEELIDLKEEIEQIIDDSFFPIYKDKDDQFKFEIYAQGDAKLQNVQARMILETNSWSFIINGNIDKKGNCIIPIKKMNLLEENTTGKMHIELISTDEGIKTMVIPYETNFKVKFNKKISIKLNETKTIAPPEPPTSGFKINIKK